jgi:hypothetical protein
MGANTELQSASLFFLTKETHFLLTTELQVRKLLEHHLVFCPAKKFVFCPLAKMRHYSQYTKQPDKLAERSTVPQQEGVPLTLVLMSVQLSRRLSAWLSIFSVDRVRQHAREARESRVSERIKPSQSDDSSQQRC